MGISERNTLFNKPVGYNGCGRFQLLPLSSPEEHRSGQRIQKGVKVCGVARTAQFLDDIKDLGYYMAFRGCLSFNLENVIIPKEKEELVEQGYKEVEEVMNNYNMGFITYNERYNQIMTIMTSLIFCL